MSKTFFVNWLNKHWNDLIDVVPFDEYKEVRDHYFLETKEQRWITELSQTNGLYDVEFNVVLFILEKWLCRQARIYEKERVSFYQNTLASRTALINRYLYNDEDDMFYDFNLAKQERVSNYDPITQYYLFWTNLSSNKKRALTLLKEIEQNNPQNYVVFMGLRRLGLIKEANEIGNLIGYQIDEYKPRISTNTGCIGAPDEYEEVLDMIKSAGFDTFDFSLMYVCDFFTSDNYLKNTRNVKAYADSLGLSCNQTHNLFPVIHSTVSADETRDRIEYTKRILKISKILGANSSIVHPINDFKEQQNYEYYQHYLSLAEQLDIKIATENMWNWHEHKATLAACSNHVNFKTLLDLVNHPHFVACVDLGHADMDGLETSPTKMIETLGDYVQCIHVHGIDGKYDLHGLPLLEQTDYEPILDSLARINYQGDITFECDGFMRKMPKEVHLSALKFMHKIGIYLREELLIRRKAICLKK